MKKCFLFTLLLVFTAIHVQAVDGGPGKGVRVGDKAPNFKLVSCEGDKVSYGTYPDAKGYIIVFTCNHCPFAKKYEDRIIALHQKYEPMGYPVIAINPNDPIVVPEDSYEEMQNRAEAKQYPFAYCIDDKQKVYPKFGATKTPQVYIVDAEQTVRYIGAIDDNPEVEQVKIKYVEDAIAAIEAGKRPRPAMTKAVGCSIKIADEKTKAKHKEQGKKMKDKMKKEEKVKKKKDKEKDKEEDVEEEEETEK